LPRPDLKIPVSRSESSTAATRTTTTGMTAKTTLGECTSPINQRADALDQKARTALSECVSLSQQSMRELRTLSYELHPPMLDELGLLPALRIYAEGFSKRSGMQVQTELPNTYPQLPRELETAVFHVIQEGLTNAQRHSASPRAKISLSVREYSNRGSAGKQRQCRAGEERSRNAQHAGARAASWRSSCAPLGSEPHSP
jgi:hypothetical protein